MIRTFSATLAGALLIASAAFAQGKKDDKSGFEGLDLTAPDQKPEETAPPPETKKPEAKKPLIEAPQEETEKLLTEKEITDTDRVKSVQNKLYRKEHRFEVAPYINVSVNDPYYSKFGGSLRAAFYFADTLAISIRGSVMQVIPTDDVRTAKATFHSRIFFSVPIWDAMMDAEWSPLYGKVSFMNSILHFDAYVLGGAGIVTTETSALPNRGPNLAADLGLGARFVTTDWLAVNVALINTTYVDQPAGTTKGATQNVMALNAGVSIFFPLRSTWKGAE